MRLLRHKLLVHFLSVILGLSGGTLSAAAAAYDPTMPRDGDARKTVSPTVAVVADAAVVRPFMLVTTALGTAAFIVTLPFSLLGGNVSEAGEKLVAGPARYTFLRPLGDMRE